MLDILSILKNIGCKQNLNIQLDIDKIELNYDTVKLQEKINFIGNIKNEDNIIYLEGIISASFPIICYSCGEEFLFKQNLEINECFVKETNAEEYLIQDNKIDIEKAVLDNLILNLPSKFLCKEDCKGICKICLQNKNYVECNCNNLETDPRFEKLKQLLK